MAEVIGDKSNLTQHNEPAVVPPEKVSYSVVHEPVAGGLMIVKLPDGQHGLTVRQSDNVIPVDTEEMGKEILKTMYVHFAEKDDKELVAMPVGWEHVKTYPVEQFESNEEEEGVMQQIEKNLPELNKTPGIKMKPHDYRMMLKNEMSKFAENATATVNVTSKLVMARSLENMKRNENEPEQIEKRTQSNLNSFSDLESMKEANVVSGREKYVSQEYMQQVLLHKYGNSKKKFLDFPTYSKHVRDWETNKFSVIEKYKKTSVPLDPFQKMTMNMQF